MSFVWLITFHFSVLPRNDESESLSLIITDQFSATISLHRYNTEFFYSSTKLYAYFRHYRGRSKEWS